MIRAKAKVAAKPADTSSEEESVDEDSIRKELGIKKHLFGYSQAELERKANGERVFPQVFGTDKMGRAHVCSQLTHVYPTTGCTSLSIRYLRCYSRD